METFKQFIERVSQDCSTGAGELPMFVGPWKGFTVIRTNHLDDKRPPSERDRDHGFDCGSFDSIISAFLKKRPLGLKDGKYSLTWKNKKGHQNAVVNVNNDKKTITFITIIQLNKRQPNDYHAKGAAALFIGNISVP